MSRGDDVLQIGRIDIAGARRYLLQRGAARFAAGVAGGLSRAGAAAVAACRSRIGWTTAVPFGVLRPRRGDEAMTSGAIANSIINLCGAIGLAVAMMAFHRRDPRGPLTTAPAFPAGRRRRAVPDPRHCVVAAIALSLDWLSAVPAAAGAARRAARHRRHSAPPRAASPSSSIAVYGALLLGLGGVLGLEA